MFSIICKVIRCIVRIAFLIASGGLWQLVAIELVLFGVGLCRYDSDECFRVITGFDGSGDIGHYEFTDNAFNRFVGWCAAGLALLCRLIMVGLMFGIITY